LVTETFDAVPATLIGIPAPATPAAPERRTWSAAASPPVPTGVDAHPHRSRHPGSAFSGKECEALFVTPVQADGNSNDGRSGGH
jgi:hypothetical protein